MKPLPLFLALFAVSCASKTPPVVKVEPSPGRHLSRAESDRVRLPETIKAYPLGRYADPNRRGVMHEAHTIYRVETTPKWNLAGRGRTTAPVTPTAARGELSANELLVELNRQREATSRSPSDRVRRMSEDRTLSCLRPYPIGSRIDAQNRLFVGQEKGGKTTPSS